MARRLGDQSAALPSSFCQSSSSRPSFELLIVTRWPSPVPIGAWLAPSDVSGLDVPWQGAARIKLLDFGLVQQDPFAVNGDSIHLTQPAETDPGVMFGPVGYMFAEQVRGEPRPTPDQPVGDSDADFDGSRGGRDLGSNAAMQRFAVEELCDGRLAPPPSSPKSSSNDVGVRQAGNRAGFTLETRHRVPVASNTLLCLIYWLSSHLAEVSADDAVLPPSSASSSRRKRQTLMSIGSPWMLLLLSGRAAPRRRLRAGPRHIQAGERRAWRPKGSLPTSARAAVSGAVASRCTVRGRDRPRRVRARAANRVNLPGSRARRHR